jgi:hypothetical protein
MIKLNSVKYLFHWIDVRDILFQLKYQYISKIRNLGLFLREFQFTLITGIFGRKRELNC